jgi:ADP-ribose pyrophosphatase YjhB (NUDIX family)
MKYCPYCRARLVQRLVENRQRLVCSGCERIIYENPVPATAAVVRDQDKRVLLVKRKVEPKKGMWCLPGGFIEVDETPEQACLRELHEETNLTGEIDRLVGVYPGDSTVYKSVLIVGYLIKGYRGSLKAGDDCTEALFYDAQKLPPIAFRSHRALLQDVWKDDND